MLLTLHTVGDFPAIFLLIISILISLRSERRHWMRLIFSSLFHGQECDSFCRLVDFLSSRSIKYFIPLSLLARFLRSRYSPYLCSSVGKVVSFPWLLSKKSCFFFFIRLICLGVFFWHLPCLILSEFPGLRICRLTLILSWGIGEVLSCCCFKYFFSRPSFRHPHDGRVPPSVVVSLCEDSVRVFFSRQVYSFSSLFGFYCHIPEFRVCPQPCPVSRPTSELSRVCCRALPWSEPGREASHMLLLVEGQAFNVWKTHLWNTVKQDTPVLMSPSKVVFPSVVGGVSFSLRHFLFIPF